MGVNDPCHTGGGWVRGRSSDRGSRGPGPGDASRGGRHLQKKFYLDLTVVSNIVCL